MRSDLNPGKVRSYAARLFRLFSDSREKHAAFHDLRSIDANHGFIFQYLVASLIGRSGRLHRSMCLAERPRFVLRNKLLLHLV